MDEKLYTINQVADQRLLLSMPTAQTIRNYLSDGRLTADINLEGRKKARITIRQSDIDLFNEKYTTGTLPKPRELRNAMPQV